MDPSHRFKLALDETRMLVLGAQVILGFQLRGTFQPEAQSLSLAAKTAHMASLLLMVAVLGLLLAPAIHHRIIDHGHLSAWVHTAVSRVMEIVLALFALALSLDIYMVLERVGGVGVAWAGALLSLAAALLFWFGLEWLTLMQRGRNMKEVKDGHIALADRIDQLLIEARVILPGAQALLGFQLLVMLTETFDRLPGWLQAVHIAALGFVTLCTILLIAPAAYHRIVFAGDESHQFMRIGSAFLMAATGMLALGLACDVCVTIAKVSNSPGWAVIAGLVCLMVLVGVWHVSPFVLREASRQRHVRHAGTEHAR